MKESLKLLILFIAFFCTFCLITHSASSLEAIAPKETVDITLTGIFDADNEITTTLSNQPYNATLSFQSSLENHPGYTFAFYVVNGMVRKDLPIDYSFRVTSHMDIQAVYAPTGFYVVLFIDSNGKLLDTQYVADDGNSDAVDPTLRGIVLPTKPGLSPHINPWKTSEGITSLHHITENRVYILQYSSDGNTNQFTLEVDGVNLGTYDFNEVVEVIADGARAGLPFSHWEEQGHPLSLESHYRFTMLSDRHLVPIYSASSPTSPIVSIGTDLALRQGYRTFMGQVSFPEGYEIIERGFVFDDTSLEYLTFDSEGVTLAQSQVFHPSTQEFVMSFPKTVVSNIRSYLTYENPLGVVETVYSSNNPRYRDIILLSSGFEDITKSSYEVEEISLDGSTWIADNALIGESDNDKKMGTKSLRLQGKITSTTPFEGLSGISFSAATYGEDQSSSLTIEISTNGIDWVDVTDALGGSPLSISSTSLVSYQFDLYQSSSYKAANIPEGASLQVRFTNLSSTNKINMDSLVLKKNEALSDDNRLNETKDQIALSSRYTAIETMSIPTNTSNGVTIQWTSNHPEVLSSSGEVHLPIGTEVEVILTADLAYGDSSVSLPFIINVGLSASDFATDLFFTEYVFGSGNNKALEIYNGTGQTVDLSQYKVRKFNNGSTGYSADITLYISGGNSFRYLDHGETLVIVNSSATSEFFTKGAINLTYSSLTNFDGNDALVLIHNGVIIDSIGQVGYNPGVAWTTNGVSTQNMTLIRKATVQLGRSSSTSPFDPSSEWSGLPLNSFTDLGKHTYLP